MENYGFIAKLGNKIRCGKTTRLSPSDFPRLLDEETNTSLYKDKEDSRLKELLVRQFALSQSLSNFLKSADTQKVITDTLKDLLQQFNGDRTYIFQYDKTKGTQSCIYEATREEVSPEIDTLQDMDINYNQWWSKTNVQQRAYHHQQPR